MFTALSMQVASEDDQGDNGRNKMQKTQSVDSSGSTGEKEEKPKYEVRTFYQHCFYKQSSRIIKPSR